MAGQVSAEAQAWTDFCQRLDKLGQELLTDEFEQAERTELFAHLAEQVVCWLGWTVFHTNPRRPFFHRQNDLVTQWGGPNNDNVYRHARIAPDLRYRIRGRMHSCENFILALRAGFMHNPVWGTVREITASELGIGPGGEFELLLGGDGTDPGWIAIPDTALMASIREYYFDWQAAEPATFTIECLDGDSSGDSDGRPTAEQLATWLGDAADQVEQSMHHWNQYQLDHKSQRVANSFAASQQVAKGLQVARYAFCFYTLGADEALVVDTDVPNAKYWSFHLYNLGCFEPINPVDHISSLNHKQAVVSDDGRIHVVVSDTDPGTVNWLDTGGHREGMLMLRWFWPTGDGAPDPSATVMPVADVKTNDVAPDVRAAAMAARRAHLAWRFRV